MKRKVKEVVSLALAAGLVVGLIAGCSTGKESGSAEGKKQVTLTFGSHQSGLPTSGIVQELAKDFESETGIKIDFQISPDAQWRDLIKVKLDSGEAPDIICVDTPIGLASSLHMDQYCPELTDQPWVSRIEKTTLAAVSVKDKVYGITFPGAKMYFYLYNKDIFKKLGLSVPTTYKEFLSVCQTLKEAGYTPIYEATTNGWHQVLPLFETGGLWLNQDPDMYEKLNENKIDLDGIPSLLNIIKQLDECAKAGYFGADYLSNAWENAKEAMATERCVMTVAELGFRGQIEKEYPDFKATEKLGAFVMPWGDNQEIGVNPASNAYFINKDSKYIEEAKQFFDFLARPENLQKRLDGQPELSALCWPEITSKYTKEDQAFLDSLKKANVVQTSVNYIDSQWMDVGKDLESMYTGAMTPEEVLKTIMERRIEQAKLQKDPGWVK
ncbi:ABC transporter substrate-binding protein [Lacrimispora xylanolytica]|uniref:ABC transporter substrate-binding protein n=1 Tax=Lacrimispora xylanolytica TaxID=29375 RepID=A0ABY7AB34_9FIRM|nr:ABC transporter substrate-binding protein [Lacrimispora xylanolytica]WAJ23904.1 ABC transporter substrate-binding protein [Lacrimispora xylanolytica]